MSTRPYSSRRRTGRTDATRDRIKAAVRDLLEEGTFHESTVEAVADRAGVSRATLYLHFRSRLELVDAICETFGANPALRRLRETVELADPDQAVAETMANTVLFWSSEDAVLSQLYGVVAVDQSARDLVGRQRNDRRGEFERLLRNLQRTGRLRDGVAPQRALSLLLVLSSYETFRELREEGHSDRQITRLLQEAARDLLLV